VAHAYPTFNLTFEIAPDGIAGHSEAMRTAAPRSLFILKIGCSLADERAQPQVGSDSALFCVGAKA